MTTPDDPTEPASRRVEDATCPACGLLCDDIALTVAGGGIVEAGSACAIGRSWFLADHQRPDLPAVTVDKHKLMEILVNLITNAAQALDEGGKPRKRLTLRVGRADERTARIEVEDDGVGIPRQNLTKIFHQGFTTKKNGHGFGLHVSANAATEMKAKLHARSDGPGRGATFAIDIPMEEATELVSAA